MATFNGEKYVEEQLDSLVRQSRPPDEIIVCDDGSSDCTLEIVEEFKTRHEIKIVVYKNSETLGFMNNFLKAASLCNGDLIAFCDQDDVWLESKIENCAYYFSDSATQLVVHGSYYTDSLGDVEECKLPSEKVQLVESLGKDPWYIPLGHTMIFRASLLSTIAPQDIPAGVTCHERWIYLLSLVFGRTILLPQALVNYRRHGGNSSPGGVERTVKTKLTDKISADSFDAHLSVAEGLASLLSDQDKFTNQERSLSAVSAAAFFRRVANNLRNRQRLYQSVCLAHRYKRLLILFLHKGYGSREHGGFGVPSLVKDLLFLRRST